jgi:hypothetical protein
MPSGKFDGKFRWNAIGTSTAALVNLEASKEKLG